MSAVKASCKSIGSLCTTPPEITFLVILAILTNLISIALPIYCRAELVQALHPMLDWYTIVYTMLTQEQAQKLAVEQNTIVDNILKEHYQMYLLDVLFKSNFEKNLVFKGGTALRLAYGSFRFSEDLDFSLQGNTSFEDFKATIESITNIIPEAKVKDIYDKHFTLYAQIMFTVDFKPIPIGIKIEVNKGMKDFDQIVTLIKSTFNNIEVTARVYTLEAILKDKIAIIENEVRREPRDLFDVWYISQKLNREFIIKDKYKYTQKELMDNLNPFIPKKHSKVMELFKI